MKKLAAGNNSCRILYNAEVFWLQFICRTVMVRLFMQTTFMTFDNSMNLVSGKHPGWGNVFRESQGKRIESP